MKNQINIADILRDKPKGTLLYSPICGDVKLERVDEDYITCFIPSASEISLKFTSIGRFSSSLYDCSEGDLMLFPSKTLRDWSIYSWHDGDVLESKDGTNVVVFHKFTDDEKRRFESHFIVENLKKEYPTYYNNIQVPLDTCNYFNSHDEKFNLRIFKQIEEHFGTMVNPYTYDLFPKFKVGDVVVMEVSSDCPKKAHRTIGVFNRYIRASREIDFYVSLDMALKSVPSFHVHKTVKDSHVKNMLLRYANDAEKKMLKDSVKAVGKTWFEDMNSIADKGTFAVSIESSSFSPYNAVLVRDTNDEKWMPAFFAYEDENALNGYRYGIISGNEEPTFFRQCIHYTKDTAHLIGQKTPFTKVEPKK